LEKVIIRKARSSDKKAVVAFCAQIWEGWDYLPRVWDQWLEDPFGAFLVAEMDGRVVGTDKITVLGPGEVWLEGLRVDPLYRGKGIAGALNERAMKIVAGLRPKVVRYGTVYDNWASRHLGEGMGFRLVFRCQRMLAQPLEGHLSGQLLGRSGDVDDIMAYLDRSKSFKQMKGQFAWGWTFKDLDRPFVERVLAEKGALIVRRGKRITGLVLFLRQRHGPKATLGFIDGGQQEIINLVRQFRIATGDRGFEHLLTMVPERLVPFLTVAGFWQEEPIHVVIYELGGERLKRALEGVRDRG
jgi:GNAT superfamily N-acetyltransferase